MYYLAYDDGMRRSRHVGNDDNDGMSSSDCNCERGHGACSTCHRMRSYVIMYSLIVSYSYGRTTS